MARCPKGHESSTADYCEVCGSPILGGPRPPLTAAAEPAEAAESAGSDDGTQTCPQCGTPRSGRFCEVDGYDFVAADLGGGPSATTPAEPPTEAPEPAATASPAPEAEPPEAEPPEAEPPAEERPAEEPAATPLAVPAAADDTRWLVTVSADKEYYDRVQAMDGPDASAMTFPEFFPERQFQLSDAKMLIGRRSRARGIEPQIDLTGPPEDPGVSHSHALLVPADGAWSVVDLDSSNGTYLNGGTDPLAPNTPVPLSDGDRIHVGAWTTLTVSTS